MSISSWSSDVCSSDLESRCWAGEFSLVPAHNDAKLFDIDAHPWGAEAGELECRLARTMIDATLHPVPAGFIAALGILPPENEPRSEEHTSELQSLMRISYAVFCLKKKKTTKNKKQTRKEKKSLCYTQ